MGKYFGTDGIRGVAGEDLTVELAYKLVRAACYKLKDVDNKLVVIGKDTRISGDMLEAALISGITSMGFDVCRLGVIPILAVTCLTRFYNACCGIVTSASHNPYEFNGIKCFSNEGFKLKDSLEEEIEYLIDHQDEIDLKVIGEKVDRVYEEECARDTYINYLLNRVDLDLTGVKVSLGCGYGAASEIAPIILNRLNVDVTVTNTEYDGKNISFKCGSANPEVISNLVKIPESGMGSSFDGDGDRLIACNETGEIMDGDHVICAVGHFLEESNKLKNDAVMGTVMTSIGLIKSLKEIGVDAIKTRVGDRYVPEEMKKNGYIIGGERSGHTIFIEDNTAGDRILSTIKLAEIAVKSKQKLSEMNNLVASFSQVLVNAKVNNEYEKVYKDDKAINEKIAELGHEFKDESRVLIRPLGTEPLIRVVIGGEDQEYLEKKAIELKDLIEERCESIREQLRLFQL